MTRTRNCRASQAPAQVQPNRAVGQDEVVEVDTRRSDVATDNPVPTPPFWGTRVVKGVALADIAGYLDERATFVGQWGLKPTRGDGGASYQDLVESEGRPRLRMWLDRIQTRRPPGTCSRIRVLPLLQRRQ